MSDSLDSFIDYSNARVEENEKNVLDGLSPHLVANLERWNVCQDEDAPKRSRANDPDDAYLFDSPFMGSTIDLEQELTPLFSPLPSPTLASQSDLQCVIQPSIKKVTSESNVESSPPGHIRTNFTTDTQGQKAFDVEILSPTTSSYSEIQLPLMMPSLSLTESGLSPLTPALLMNIHRNIDANNAQSARDVVKSRTVIEKVSDSQRKYVIVKYHVECFLTQL